MPKLSSRLLRRIIIAAVFFAVFVLSGWGFRKAVTPVATCTDGIMNGQEEGVDCGTSACSKYCEPELAPPKVLSTKLIKAGDGDYDFIAQVENPHPQFGASEVDYELILFNAEDEELLKKQDLFYILPGQTKNLIFTHLTTENNVKRIEFNIKSAKWQKITSLEGMNLIVRNEKYYPTSSGGMVKALLLNDSDFDFEVVDIDVILFNSRGDIVAVHRTDVRTFVARTERSFEVVWPFRISSDVAKIEIYPATNLFENYNFIKSFGSEIEKFQHYKAETIWH